MEMQSYFWHCQHSPWRDTFFLLGSSIILNDFFLQTSEIKSLPAPPSISYLLHVPRWACLLSLNLPSYQDLASAEVLQNTGFNSHSFSAPTSQVLKGNSVQLSSQTSTEQDGLPGLYITDCYDDSCHSKQDFFTSAVAKAAEGGVVTGTSLGWKRQQRSHNELHRRAEGETEESS